MHENEISRVIVDACFEIHTTLGPGLFETVYDTVLEYELHKRGLCHSRQVAIPVYYDGMCLSEGFRTDFIVEDKVLVELKSVESTMPVHRKQVITYLKLSNLRLGLLINFGSPLLRDGITRLVNRLQE